jgi:hypothetical protein
MSKMAAFRAGKYRDQGGLTGPTTRVPINEFLRNNGFVPPLQNDASQHGAVAKDMPTFSGDETVTPNGRPASGPFHTTLRNPNSLETSNPFPPGHHGVKGSPGSFTDVTPEPILSSIERDVPTADSGDRLAQMQTEMHHMRSMIDNNASNTNNVLLELTNVQAKMHSLEVKYNQLHGMVIAIQNNSLPSIVERVNELESIVGDLQQKVGSGSDAEVAKMREVMGDLKSSLNKVGGFL